MSSPARRREKRAQARELSAALQSERTQLIARAETPEEAHLLDKVFGLAVLGANNRELGALLGVSEEQIEAWTTARPRFGEALSRGKAHADANVVAALYRNSIGFEYPAEKIFCNSDGVVTRVPYMEYHKPDSTAAMYWTKNRQRDRWREAAADLDGVGFAIKINLG